MSSSVLRAIVKDSGPLPNPGFSFKSIILVVENINGGNLNAAYHSQSMTSDRLKYFFYPVSDSKQIGSASFRLAA